MSRTKSAETIAKESAEAKQHAKNVATLLLFPELVKHETAMKSALADLVKDTFRVWGGDDPAEVEAMRFILETLRNAESKMTGIFNENVKSLANGNGNRKFRAIRKIGGDTGAPKKVAPVLTAEQIAQNKLVELGLA